MASKQITSKGTWRISSTSSTKFSLPAVEEFQPQIDAFWQAAARPGFQARHSKAFEDGYQQRSDVELRLGEYVGQIAKTELLPEKRPRNLEW